MMIAASDVLRLQGASPDVSTLAIPGVSSSAPSAVAAPTHGPDSS